VTATTLYHLGRLRFALSGTAGCTPALRRELAPLLEPLASTDAGATPIASDHSSHVAFDFVESLPEMADYTAAKPVAVLHDALRVAHRGLEYQMSRRGDHPGARSASRITPHRSLPRISGRLARPGQLHLAIRQTHRGRSGPFAETVQRMRDPGYLSIDERCARAFMYDVFDYVAQIAQLPLGQSFIHAGAVERDGGGTALVAWSGVGKTAALLQLVTRHGFRYLSDDVAVVDDTGTLWRSPKLIQLKGINVKGYDDLRTMLLSGRPLLDRLSWAQRYRRHGALGVRRRISAEALFGEAAVARSAPLRSVVALERADVADFEVSDILLPDLCRRTAAVVMDVMGPFTFLSQAVQSGSRTSSMLPTYGEVLAETTAVLGRAFRMVPMVNVRIPLAAPPAALAACLAELVDRMQSMEGARPAERQGRL
jgi:hypothetical protein